MKKLVFIISVLTLAIVPQVSADELFEEGLDEKAMKGKITHGNTKREKDLSFDDGESVEGLNKSPRNFGELTVNSRKKSKGHLYNRVINFDSDRRETIRNMRYSH